MCLSYVLRICFLLLLIVAAFFMRLSFNSQQRNDPAQEERADRIQNDPSMQSDSSDTEILVHIKRQSGEEISVPLEDYLIGVVSSEMSADFPLEALKAQAVAARTFVCKRNFIVDDTTASQVYQDDSQLKMVWGENYDEHYEKIRTAVSETKGEILTYQGEVITAAFFSSCNGYTNNAGDYWQNDTPYLRSVESPWDQKITTVDQEVTFTTMQLAQALGFSDPIQLISPPQRYDNGYVKSVTIDGVAFSGRELREALGLRSSAFDIWMDQDQVKITTHGFGHGIGMSQYGAQGMAKEGKSYREILMHYYSGVEIALL